MWSTKNKRKIETKSLVKTTAFSRRKKVKEKIKKRKSKEK